MNQEKFKKSNKACFLDRDGVINEDIGYLYKIEDFKWIDGAQNAINYLKKNGYLVIVVTNQSGVKRQFYSKNDVNKLHNWMNKQLKENHDTFIDDFFFSIDLPNSDINSDRKPSPIMINNAVKKYVTAFIPRVNMHKDGLNTFFELYPDGYLTGQARFWI